VSGPIPPAAQQQDALALALQAAGHALQGDMALYKGAVAVNGGAPTQLKDTGLITQPQDQSWRRSWLLFLDGANAGQERFVQSVDGGSGILRWQPQLDSTVADGTRFVLFRDYRFAQWLAWLNETARNLHYPLDVYVPAAGDDRLRYTMPDPIQRAGWLGEILIGPATVAYTSPEARAVRWFHVNPTNVEGDLYLVLSRPLARHQQLLFRARPPFAYEHQDAYTGMHSVLWPAGRDPATAAAVRPPVRLFVLGTVWRSLQQKVTNLTGQPRALWQQNLERCARQYAQACAEWGPKDQGWEVGYVDDWYPTGSVSWGVP
jgi:hypothetical protein